MKIARPYQRVGIERGITANLLLNDDRGLGKTFQAIEIAKAVSLVMPGPILIVCPKSVRNQWIEAIEDQTIPADLRVYTIDVQTPLPDRPFRQRPTWIVTHYEAMLRHVRTLSKTFYGTIIVDEAHRIRNRTAQRTIALKKLQAYRKIALTGTAFDKNPADVWSILNWLDPEKYSEWRGTNVYSKFFDRHTAYEPVYIRGEKTDHKRVTGIIDPELFAAELAPYTLARTKREVAPELPAKIQQIIPIVLMPKQAELYERIEYADDILVDLDGSPDPVILKNVLTRIGKLQQLASDPKLLGVDMLGAKLEWLREFIDDQPDRTLLILTRFRDTAIRIGNMFDIPVVVGGKRPAIDLRSAPMLVGTIAAMGEGLDLGQIWTTVFIDAEWSSLLMLQAIDRTERDLAATEPRHIIYLRAVDTVDVLIYRALAKKWTDAELVTQYLQQRAQAQDFTA